ncbi:MAG: hypothetical protein M0017_02330 [Desulfobacteraceae bacterium]|nr:hypothetical protein [Desulfobacteraceae bacterium]
MTASGPRRLTAVLPWVTAPLIFGLLSLCLGQDANWDLRNYHFYNPYAWLHQRLDYDMAPAQVANFYNPLLFVPYYFLVTTVPPRAAAFLLGAAQGLNLPLLAGIGRSAMAGERKSPPWLPLLLGLLGLLGAGSISELGTMFADNLISLPVLGGIWLLTANYRRLLDPSRPALPLAAAGGVLFGLAAGLKQPAAVFAVGWCVAFLIVPVLLRRRVALAFVFGLGVLAGIAATGGFWMVELWQRYGNPLFPYFNRLFASPMASLSNYRDPRFLPRSLIEALLFPFLIVRDPHHTAEIFFRDLRFPLFAILLATAGLIRYRRFRNWQEPVAVSAAAPGDRKGLFLLCGALAAYAVWLRLFAIYRYLLPLEMLAPLGIWLLISGLPLRQAAKYRLAAACGLLLVITLRPGTWGRVPFGDDFFGVTPPPIADPARTMVLMTGVAPMAYVIPFFPAPVRFVRIQSYFTGPSPTPNGFDRRMRQLVAAHRGPLYVLFSSNEGESAAASLAAYGLALDAGNCRTLKTHVEEHLDTSLSFCAVARLDSSLARGERR